MSIPRGEGETPQQASRRGSTESNSIISFGRAHNTRLSGNADPKQKSCAPILQPYTTRPAIFITGPRPRCVTRSMALAPVSERIGVSDRIVSRHIDWEEQLRSAMDNLDALTHPNHGAACLSITKVWH